MDILNVVKDIGQSVLSDAKSKLSSKAYKSLDGDVSVTIKINEKQLKNSEIMITRVRTETSLGPEAGICEVELRAQNSPTNCNISSEFSQIKVGKKLEVLIGNTVVFTGFIERFDIEISPFGSIICTVHGMDAKMWMMTNVQTKARSNVSSTNYKSVVQNVLKEYVAVARIGKNSPGYDTTVKNIVYQANESDFKFLTRIANITGSLFFVDSEGKMNFCGPNTLYSSNTMKLDCSDKNSAGEALSLNFSASVWGMPKSVKVVSQDSLDPSKIITATSSSSSSIGSGQSLSQIIPRNCAPVEIKTDTSIKSKDEAKALADAIYSQKNLNLTAVEMIAKGNPSVKLGGGFYLDGFGAPVDNGYIINRVIHNWDVGSNTNKYTTTLILSANKITLQKG